ncbi:unnamed protein product [Photorhabdus laumondii subsp. laumondii TTO1]|uniref:Photorhabdus luminescens subsp. laumondii TTO1 complete genome segment 4/17 n=2 Tax=Photorhabdus TaxID=29487 RepID=Q7N819_PHOLL|nr:unnamed protein product [Photorhabdus laumondii subsp. laumondii TTO1]
MIRVPSQYARSLDLRCCWSVFEHSAVSCRQISSSVEMKRMVGVKSCGFIDISVQVLNEVAHVCVRKLKMSWEEIAEFLDIVRSFCKIVPLTVEVHDRARLIAERYRLSFYDSCIVAAAVIAGCRTLYSEDMNHGQMLEDSLVIKNPFSYV